jgi:hypothetical protein
MFFEPDVTHRMRTPHIPDGANPPPGRAARIGETAAAAAYAALISILLGFAVSAFGTVTSSTPSL